MTLNEFNNFRVWMVFDFATNTINGIFVNFTDAQHCQRLVNKNLYSKAELVRFDISDLYKKGSRDGTMLS